MDLQQALDQFDRAETNLDRLETVAEQLEALIPDGISFADASPEGRKHAELRRTFAELVGVMPAIDGLQLGATPPTLNEIAQWRMEATDLGEPQVWVDLSEAINAPSRAIAEYRDRLIRARKTLVRERTKELIARIDELLPAMAARVERDGTQMAGDPDWQELSAALTEIQRLVGADIVQTGRWSALGRHLGFSQAVDLCDIAEYDWPSVRPDIEAALYGELDPLPIEASDLGELVATKPAGEVTTKLNWNEIDAEQFERLTFNLLTDASGYANPRWLMQTNAPDRGRDLSVERIRSDSLSGDRRDRVIVQCKHWLSKSISVGDCVVALEQIKLWQPPPIDVLVIATSGRFTADAVKWIEDRTEAREIPAVEMWPDSHLEWLLATRATLVNDFPGFRPA